MKNYKSSWRWAAGGLFAIGILANSARAYTTTDLRVPSPTYYETNSGPVLYNTPGGQIAINSFFDVFADFQRIPPPAPGTSVNSFFDVFTDFYLTPPASPPIHEQATAAMTIHLNGLPPGTPFPDGLYTTEMLQMDLAGGSLPAGVLIRESPTLASTGQTTVASLGGGQFQINSFFDVFTELSIDGGASWAPASGPLHIVGTLPEPSSAMLAMMGLAAIVRLRGRRVSR